MKINTKKTQLIVISPQNGCITSAVTTVADGTRVESQPSLKLVGFYFGTAAGVDAHVEELQGKFRRKIWIVYHPREAGLSGDNFFKIYCCYVRADRGETKRGESGSEGQERKRNRREI